MSTNRGIFDSLPSQPNGGSNPFSFAGDATAAQNPFASVPTQASPFAAVPDHVVERNLPEPGKPAKIPAPRPKPQDSPFQMAPENGVPFGYEAPQVSQLQSAPFSPVTAEVLPLPPAPAQASPFGIHREAVAPAPIPFTPAPVAPAPAAPQQSFGGWPQHVETAPSPFSVATAPAPAPAPASAPIPAPVAYEPAPVIPVPAPVPAPAPAPVHVEEIPAMRQLELRAIFGVDREMTAEEILQRTRSLPGVKHATRISAADVASLENLKKTLTNLGFGGGNIRLYSGSVPIEFVRDGNTMLAVQTDGGFAPGVKEAIMIVARELEKMG